MRKVLAGRGPSVAAWATAACVLAGITPDARAARWQDSSGDWSFNWDTTIGYAQGWRVSSPDCRVIATANGGCGYSPNVDNGDLNFLAKATFSQAATGVTELALNYKEKAGLFVRASGLYDFEVMDNNGERRIPLDHFAKDYVGSYVRLLDAFGFWRFDLGTRPSELRLGRQVVSWGESTFIPNGLNQVNHFDVANLRTPGSELKTALLPDDMVVFNSQLTKNVSTQLLYLLDWNKTIVEPNCSYFSTNDGGTPGGNKVFLGFGQISDLGVNFAPLGGPFISNFQAINRLPDHNPSNAGQYGINFKVNFPSLNHGTQIGFYFMNYTSKVPVVSAQTGTQAGVANGFGAVSAVGGAAQALAAGLPFNEAVAVGAAAGQQRATQLGGNLSATTATQYATIGANTLLAGGSVAAQAQSLGTNEYGQTAGYFEEYPQDIKLMGVSFNTQIQQTGTALQGELSYRHGIPFQVDDTELLYGALTPFESGVAQLLGEPVSAPGQCQPTGPTPVTGCNQLGAFGLNQTVTGWERKNMWQAQATATQIFANVFKASQLVLVFEGAVDYVPQLNNLYTGGPVGLGLRLDGPGTNLSGNPQIGSYPQYPNLYESGARFPTSWSYGYVAAARLEYTNLIPSVNILPHITWSQDLSGISPGPGGNFLEGRHAVTVGVGANLHQRWDFDVSYTQYGGAAGNNLLNDRDFVGASIKYSF